MPLCGLANVDKPSGISSRRVVDVVARLARPAKAGHAGTLDPIATGVLVVAVGPATRLVPFVHGLSKNYDATFLLGRTSPTDDVEGEVVEIPPPYIPQREEIERQASALVGEIEQRPPAYSAVKVAGQRAYQLARRGRTVEPRPRRVVVHSIAVSAYEYPELRLSIDCGSGTYVRAIGRDLAQALGTCAVMSQLRRTRIGPFRIENAVSLESIRAGGLAGRLLPPLAAVDWLPRVTLDDETVRRVALGQRLRDLAEESSGVVHAVDESGVLVAVLARQEDGAWRPQVNFPRSAV